jgi:predicted nucleic acid-binding protein
MPTLLVSDTSVLIDLERGGLVEALFRLPFDVAVPDVMFEREIKTSGGPDLLAMGLKVLALEPDGVALAQDYSSIERRLSLPDAMALALAKVGGHVLLAGDASLRALAEREGVESHGVLWVLDQLEAEGVLANDELSASLTIISEHPRCRLPKEEIRKRLTAYARAT